MLAKTGDSRPDKVSTIISSKRIVPTSFDREKLKTPYPRRRDDDWDEDDPTSLMTCRLDCYNQCAKKTNLKPLQM